MSYQVLARKWRPQNFKQMVGQEHVLQALIHALDSQRLHHAYLFTGTRGVGKTTIGRILAKCLSCQGKVTSEPCGECAACTSITEGRYVDLIEIDAASRTKVEDMRELLENVQYAPTQGRFKIYLIDEVHMLSQSSFNALLKTLEEPPEHVKFLFATTDPQKLPVTILSRCLQFNLKNMPPEKIVSHLKHVLSEESVIFEDAALWALARAADGSMRDALSLTDQAIAYGNQVLSETGVSTMLGTVDQKKIYRILDALITKQASDMLTEVHALSEFSPDYRSVLATLSSILHRVALEQVVPNSVDNSMGDQQQIQYYAKNVYAEDIQLFYQIALTSRQDLHITPDTKSGFEMALLRMLAFQMSPVPSDQQKPLLYSASQESDSGDISNIPDPIIKDLSSQQEGSKTKELSAELDSVTSPVPDSVNSPELLTQESNIMSDQNVDEQAALSQDIVDNQYLEIPKIVESEEAHTPADLHESGYIEEAAVQLEPEVEKKTLNNGEASSEPVGWNADVIELGLTGMTLNFMLNSVVSLSLPEIHVHVERGHFRLFNENHEKRIREALLAFYSGSSSVTFLEGLENDQETPMMWRDRKVLEKKAYAKELIFKDPYVQEIVDAFEGNLIEQSIQPED